VLCTAALLFFKQRRQDRWGGVRGRSYHKEHRTKVKKRVDEEEGLGRRRWTAH